jgi:hypothetical protein
MPLPKIFVLRFLHPLLAEDVASIALSEAVANKKLKHIVNKWKGASYSIMSLSSRAPEFQPSASSHVTNVSQLTSHYVVGVPELGYEFPYVMKAMPLPNFTRVQSIKRVWTEMAHSVSSYLKRY